MVKNYNHIKCWDRNVTFLAAAALQVALGAVLTGVAGPSLPLQQLVYALDDALQRLIHVQPNLLLEDRE